MKWALKRYSNRFGRYALIIGVLGALLFSFQNCGKAGFSSIGDELSSSTTKNSIEANAPFAYKTSFDTIAYNSCSGTGTVSKAPFFTFRAGAYATEGVQVSKEFFDYAKSKLRPSYPNTEIIPEQYRQLLANSPANQSAQLQFSVRQLSNVRAADSMIRSGNTPILGSDYINILGPMSDERWGLSLFKGVTAATVEPDPVRYFESGQRGFRSVEVSHQWSNSETQAQSVRDMFNREAVLALTAEDSTSGSARGPGEDKGRAYGTGFKLSFGVENPAFLSTCVPVVNTSNDTYAGCSQNFYNNPAPNSLNPDNSMIAIQEMDLVTGQIENPAAWSCEPAMRFLVVRLADQATLCPKGEDKTNLDLGRFGNVASYYRQLEIVRRVLPADQWDVNLTRRCAVPKEGDCYPQEKINGRTPRVQYDTTKTCFRAVDGVGYTTAPTEVCAHFVSICTKN